MQEGDDNTGLGYGCFTNKKQGALRSEYGTCGYVTFLTRDNVHVYDLEDNSEDNEICIPKCTKCQCYKGLVSSKKYSTWMCMSCDGQ